MNKILLSGILLGVVVFGGCHINGDRIKDKNNKADNKRSIIVQGNGNVNVVPNQVSVQIAVETNAAQANEAVKTNATQMEQVVNQLKNKLGPDDKLSTSRYNLNPVYKYDQAQQKSILTGYQVTNYVTFTTKQVDDIGVILDSVAETGANRIDSLSFTRDDLNIYTREALAAAVKDAHETAETLAQAANVSLGSVLLIQPQVSSVGPLLMAKVSANSQAETPIVSGGLTVTQAVQVTYKIK